MAKTGKTKTIVAVITCAVLVAMAFAGLILAGSDVKDTAEDAEAAVVELKADGCDPVHSIDKRCLVLETKWEAINVSQKKLETGQEKILEALQK